MRSTEHMATARATVDRVFLMLLERVLLRNALQAFCDACGRFLGVGLPGADTGAMPALVTSQASRERLTVVGF